MNKLDEVREAQKAVCAENSGRSAWTGLQRVKQQEKLQKIFKIVFKIKNVRKRHITI